MRSNIDAVATLWNGLELSYRAGLAAGRTDTTEEENDPE